MAGERALPGLGLFAFWAEGSNGYKEQMDGNLRLLSALTQCAVLSATTALPAGANGDMYLVPSGAGANANQIAVKDDGAWVYIVPREGMIVYVRDTDIPLVFKDAAWAPLVIAPAAPLAPIVTKTASYELTLAEALSYLRMNVATANTFTVPANATAVIPIGTEVVMRQVGVGQTTLVAAAGVTLNTSETLKLRKQHSTVALRKVATNEWDVTGDLELVE